MNYLESLSDKLRGVQNVGVAGIIDMARTSLMNYTEAEVKVREATNLESWGPTSTQMADIAKLTYRRYTPT